MMVPGSNGNSEWRSRAGPFPTPRTLVLRARGTGADAELAAFRVANRYQDVVVAYLAVILERDKAVSDATTAQSQARDIYQRIIHGKILARLADPNTDYSRECFRSQLCEWIHEAYWRATNYHRGSGVPDSGLFDNVADRAVIKDTIERLRQLHVNNQTRRNDYLIISWQINMEDRQDVVEKDWLESFRSRFQAETGEVISKDAFRQRAKRTRDQFSKLLLSRVQEDLGHPSKDREWEAFLRLELVDYVLESPFLERYFSEQLK